METTELEPEGKKDKMVTEVKVSGKVRPHLLQYLPEFHAEQATKLKMLSRTV